MLITNIIYRSFSCSRVSLHEHDFDKADRLDGYLSTIDPEKIRNYRVNDIKDKKIRQIIGLHSYLFSNTMSLSISPNEFELKRHMVQEKAESFLKGLKEDTVYKALFVGITADGEIMSSTEGSFFISRSTRSLYITMKLKKTISSFAFRYNGVDFDS